MVCSAVQVAYVPFRLYLVCFAFCGFVLIVDRHVEACCVSFRLILPDGVNVLCSGVASVLFCLKSVEIGYRVDISSFRCSAAQHWCDGEWAMGGGGERGCDGCMSVCVCVWDEAADGDGKDGQSQREGEEKLTARRMGEGSRSTIAYVVRLTSREPGPMDPSDSTIILGEGEGEEAG